MIESSAPPGSDRWQLEHRGIVTSRHADRIVTKTWRQSAGDTRAKLIRELVAEWASGEVYNDWRGNEATEAGSYFEPEAIDWYEAATEPESTRQPSIIYRDETRLVGTTPDLLVGEEGSAEIKSPGKPRHYDNVLCCDAGECPPYVLHQCQWHLWITGRAWCDFLTYNRTAQVQGMIRVYPLDEAFKAFEQAVPAFVESLIARRHRLLELGVVPAEPGMVPDADAPAASLA